MDDAEEVTDELTRLQVGFKRQLVKDVREFVVQVIQFRNDYVANGPMVRGIEPKVAVERLRRYKEQYVTNKSVSLVCL